MGKKVRALEESVRRLRDQLITADQSHLRILAKRKDLSARYADYVKGSRKRMQNEKEKIRKKMQASAAKAAKAAKEHSDRLAGMLKACETRLAEFDLKRKEEHKISEKKVGSMQSLLDAATEKTKEKETENKKLEKKNTALTEANGLFNNLIKTKAAEIEQERERFQEMVKKLSVEAEAAVVEDVKQDAKMKKEKKKIVLLVTPAPSLTPNPKLKKPGPSTETIVERVQESWIFPKTKKDAIESVFNLNEDLKIVVMNQPVIKENLNKFTMWSLLYDGVGLEQDFNKQLPQSIYRDPPREPSIIQGVKSPTNRDTIRATSDTAPAIFYAPKGDIRIQILVPSRFILTKETKPKGATGPHVLIGFSVYLQILKADDSVSSFFMNLELKHNEVEKNLPAKTFYPTKSVLEIAESGITSQLEGQLASGEVAYSGNQQNILKTIQSSGTWKNVRGHVTRVYLHGNATKPIREWTRFRQEELDHSHRKLYGHIEENFKQWLISNKEHLSFVTTTNIAGTRLNEAIETKLPNDTDKWLRQTSFTATPEFW